MIKITNIFISEIGHLFNEQQLNSREVFYYGETYLWKEWASTF